MFAVLHYECALIAPSLPLPCPCCGLSHVLSLRPAIPCCGLSLHLDLQIALLEAQIATGQVQGRCQDRLDTNEVSFVPGHVLHALSCAPCAIMCSMQPCEVTSRNFPLQHPCPPVSLSPFPPPLQSSTMMVGHEMCLASHPPWRHPHKSRPSNDPAWGMSVIASGHEPAYIRVGYRWSSSTCAAATQHSKGRFRSRSVCGASQPWLCIQLIPAPGRMILALAGQSDPEPETLRYARSFKKSCFCMGGLRLCPHQDQINSCISGLLGSALDVGLSAITDQYRVHIGRSIVAVA